MKLIQIVTEKKCIPITTSRMVAGKFEKQHKDVLESIRNLTAEKSAAKFFYEATYKSRGKEYPIYEMDRDGFSLLVMGFTGEKALQWKIKYIEAFNAMEEFIKSLEAAKLEFPAFTAAIMEAHEEPKNYHFSNEINMINRIVLGVDEKHFKEQRGIDKNIKSIRPYLESEEIKAIEELQRADIGLMVAGLEYEQRKEILEGHYSKRILQVAG